MGPNSCKRLITGEKSNTCRQSFVSIPNRLSINQHHNFPSHFSSDAQPFLHVAVAIAEKPLPAHSGPSLVSEISPTLVLEQGLG